MPKIRVRARYKGCPSEEVLVLFDVMKYNRRPEEFYITIRFGEKPGINIPATGTMAPEDVEVFIEAVKLANRIASGELEIDLA